MGRKRSGAAAASCEEKRAHHERAERHSLHSVTSIA
jgi:hypothetical protein